ncbi:fumarate hydratase [Sphaerobacter thermophilus]|uniref:Hydro-lyase, Fe-S type, tartrate/fumarate subfamily, alpha subunit n=1 Tax=Sphaerobacter thermophilus (strain ATCC 49802 / DSM 20745 / KCCM 41009 / NCIMB 13125 / S 6022) TaxID=479434 RepID=D1C5J3_SPHTD|nr:fumarate hydratase [Sphaerobacter thermophilus]ACZ37509.1 hydro-lyase, Fe-S type, tartrate/fumarate subfamily, alpha subunit [Sphaerobacter thermophilus DSM 20745]
MREIHVDRIAEAVREACLEANYVAGEDVRRAFTVARKREVSPLGQQVLEQILENMAIAEADRVPMCQDTGTVVVFAEVGQDVHLVGGGFEEAINRGVHEAYHVGYLRKSMVERPFTARRNTRDNTPAIIHTRLVPGDRVRLAILAKGGGAENMSRLAMLTPAHGREGIVRFVLETVQLAGPNACPPVVVGVGIGATFDRVATLAKQALLREIGSENLDPEEAELEAELLAAINRLGIGPHGFGGRITALAVHVVSAPCHIASLPVAVNLQCGPAARHREVEI